MKCKICGSLSSPFDKGRILGKYTIRYFYCDICGFIQTESPFWLAEAYSTAITDTDVGLVNRNLIYSKYTEKFIRVLLNSKSKYVDYGGGYGLFVRLMRDKGLDFYRFDPIAENIFAKYFEAEEMKDYELLTAWEVFEHLSNPLADLEIMHKFSENILFSTLLHDEIPSKIDSWTYYGLEHGQHISFYSKKTIEYIAKKFSLKLIFSYKNTHFLSSNTFKTFRISFLLHKYPRILDKLFLKTRLKSLVESDYEKIRRRINDNASRLNSDKGTNEAL